MTAPQGQPIPLVAGALFAGDSDLADEANTDDREIIGASDADADAVRAGAQDVDLSDARRDSDGVPVGRDDQAEDVARAGD